MQLIMEKNPMYFCLSCNKYLGFRGFCSLDCHNKYYDSLQEFYKVEEMNKIKEGNTCNCLVFQRLGEN